MRTLPKKQTILNGTKTARTSVLDYNIVLSRDEAIVATGVYYVIAASITLLFMTVESFNSTLHLRTLHHLTHLYMNTTNKLF